jgi:hypothetical protein
MFKVIVQPGGVERCMHGASLISVGSLAPALVAYDEGCCSNTLQARTRKYANSK